MRVRSILMAAMLLAIMAILPPVSAGDQEMAADAPIHKVPADLKWVDYDPTGAPGVKIATLWGDYRTGAFGAFFRLPAGFAAPLHTHSHSMKLVIVSGTYIQAPAGKPEFRLGPGSYLMQPGDKYRHTTSCAAGSECLFFVESEGAFDLHFVTEMPAGPQ